MEFDRDKGYVPIPPNQNPRHIQEEQHNAICNTILQYLLDGKNTNGGLWFFVNISTAFPNIPVRTLDNVIFPRLLEDGLIRMLDGIDAPSSKRRAKFVISDRGKVFISKGGYAVAPSKTVKDFVFELLTRLDDSQTTIDVYDFVADFYQIYRIDRSTIGLKMKELVSDGLITCVGHEHLTSFGGQVSHQKPSIYASITREGEAYLERLKQHKMPQAAIIGNNNTLNATNINQVKDTSKVFIVHGHDDLAKTEVARFIENLGFEPIILHEQASGGQTIIEKIEKYTNVGFGIILYTPCDEGGKLGQNGTFQPRARQNVLLEHGYLMGKLGRDKVCALVKGHVEKPSDISGIVYIDMDARKAWHKDVAKEMEAAGYEIDGRKLLRL